MIFSSIVILFFVGITLVYIRNTLRSHRYLSKNNTLDMTKARNNIVILIPIYQEEHIIAQTMDYFYNIAAKLNIKIIFITTEREGGIAKNKTYLSAKKLIGNKRNILLVHYPEIHGAKAAQLNWVMDNYQGKADYFAIFDADSRPDDRGIQYVIQAEAKADVFQMPSIYAPHPSRSLASQAIAAFQTRWSYCFEIPKWLTWQNQPNEPHVMYVVGHGLFINPHIRFSEQTIAEDLELGYRLSAKSAMFALVPFFDNAAVPKSFIISIIQSSRWYYGELIAPITFWKAAKHNNTNKYIFKAMIRTMQILLWMLGPALVLLSIFIVTESSVLLIIGLISIGLYFIPSYLICAYGQASLQSLILMPLRLLSISLGPMLCIVYINLDRLKLRKFSFTKTEM
jgi:cellulose synthase/poly-beta-1,6-N-acetylglucosamine synthase-like glycosyltransferase